MPGVYKQKECPKCGTQHRKRGPFCSFQCSNSKPATEEKKKKISRSINEYHDTPEGIAYRKKMIEIGKGNEDYVSIDEFAVDIPEIKDLSDYDILDSYSRAEKW